MKKYVLKLYTVDKKQNKKTHATYTRDNEPSIYYWLGRMSVYWGEKYEKNLAKYWEISKDGAFIDAGRFYEQNERNEK